MKTLIKYYDKDVLKNISAALALKPEKIIFFYDNSIQDMTWFHSLKKCFKHTMPNIVMEHISLDILDMVEIYSKTKKALEENEECAMEFTGGSELMLIAGFKAGAGKGVPLYYTDLVKGMILDLSENKPVANVPKIKLEHFMDARGACLMGHSHKEPLEQRYNDILNMCDVLFNNINHWKTTSNFIQIVAARYSSHEMYMKSKIQATQKNGKKVTPDKKILYAFQKFGFIRDLKMTQENVSFSFRSAMDKQYVINYGIWLELFVYIHAKQSCAFDDVWLGALIDWNAYDASRMAGNEIDVVLSDQSMPVFISCKLRSADAAAVNELMIEKKRIGGWFSKGILVAFGRDKQEKTATYLRAKEFGIEILDAKDILSANFGQRLVKVVKEHDLNSLKWKKV